MSDILTKLGLTKEQVRGALGSEPLQEEFADETPELSPKNYLFAHDQRRIRTRLRLYEGFIYARFEEGYHPGTIARLLSVSEETVRSRLRKGGFFNRKKPGRPPKTTCLPDDLPPSLEDSTDDPYAKQ